MIVKVVNNVNSDSIKIQVSRPSCSSEGLLEVTHEVSSIKRDRFCPWHWEEWLVLSGEKKMPTAHLEHYLPQHKGFLPSWSSGVGVNLDSLTSLSCKKSSYPSLL